MMYEVTDLYTVTGSSIVVDTSSEVSPEVFVSNPTINTKLYIGIKIENDVEVGLNYSRLITDKYFNEAKTWVDVCNGLTEELILGYQEVVPGYTPGMKYPRDQVITWDVMTFLNTFNVVLYDHRSLEEPRIRHIAEDIYITIQKDAKEYPKLENCIPVVNGYVCRPIMHRGGMIVKGAAKLFWNASVNLTPEVQLLDFSKIGPLYVVPITKDKVIYHKGTYQLRVDNLPLTENSYLPVINGYLICPDRYTALDENNIKFTIHHHPFNMANAYRAFLDGDIPYDSLTAYQAKTVREHLDNQIDILSPEITDDFTIVVGAPIIYVARYRLDIFNNGFIMNMHNEEGILMNEKTGLIMDYHRVKYNDRQELIVQDYDSLYITDRLYDERQVVFVKPDSDYIEEFNPIHHGDTIMMYLMK